MPIADSCLEIHLLRKVLPSPCKTVDASLASWLEGDLISEKRHINHLLEWLDTLLATLLHLIQSKLQRAPWQGQDFQVLENSHKVFTNNAVRSVVDKTCGESTPLSSCSSLAAKSAPWGLLLDATPQSNPSDYLNVAEI